MRRISWKWRKEKVAVNNDPPPYPGPISPSSPDSRVGLHVFHASQDDIVEYNCSNWYRDGVLTTTALFSFMG